jgi:beta-N-acetylhexosaminidase
VVDVNGHPGSPIANTRGLGDDTARVTRMARALVAGMQARGLAATVKHFPGDGWDDRDQHLATTINPLTRAEWERTSGVPFRRTFEDGCWTTMIALPAVDAGDPTDPNGPPPAILSKKITTDFLRGDLGFQGLVVSDAIQMNGSLSRVRSSYELIVKLVNAGNDQLLFCEARRDFAHLQKAVACGDISLERIDEACARVLTLKEQLGFATDPASARPRASAAEAQALSEPRFGQAAAAIAQRALTTVRSDGRVPLSLNAGDRVLVMHLRSNPEYQVDGLDSLLQARGLVVDRRTEADSAFALHGVDFTAYKLVLFAWVIGPTWGTNFIRPAGAWARSPWFVRQHQPVCPVVHVSFGSPYLGHDVPWADTLLNAYSPDAHTQAAVVGWLFGEVRAQAISPVDLGRHDRIRDLIAREFAR